jgi:CRP-like cAMP-binding protein
MKTLHFNPDDLVFKAESPIETLMFKVFCFINQRDKQVIGVFDQDDLFGEMGLINGKPRSTTVIALS